MARASGLWIELIALDFLVGMARRLSDHFASLMRSRLSSRRVKMDVYAAGGPETRELTCALYDALLFIDLEKQK